MRGDETYRQNHITNEQQVNKIAEVEMATQYANNELKRLRSDHDQAIANLAENMNRWNDTLRDLSKELHDFQTVMIVNTQKMQSSLWDVQAGPGAPRGERRLVRVNSSMLMRCSWRASSIGPTSMAGRDGFQLLIRLGAVMQSGFLFLLRARICT